MCNLYSLTKGQAAVRDWFRARYDRSGNLPLFPGIFPNQMAPIVRAGADGERELVMARCGMPGPPQYGGAPVTNIRNLLSPHWRGWLGKQNRCLVPATSFCEFGHQAAQDAHLVRPERRPAAVRFRRPVGFLARPTRS
jgi:putative SOS response-associated peptidase YedK